ncbi:hypothetical protein YC2023_116479 [Brassica napus]
MVVVVVVACRFVSSSMSVSRVVRFVWQGFIVVKRFVLSGYEVIGSWCLGRYRVACVSSNDKSWCLGCRRWSFSCGELWAATTTPDHWSLLCFKFF